MKQYLINGNTDDKVEHEEDTDYDEHDEVQWHGVVAVEDGLFAW